MVTTALTMHRYGPQHGLPLVLLHGFPLDSRMWDGVVAELAGDLPVIAVDAPGFGASSAPEAVAAAVGRSAEPSLETYADAVAQSLRAAGVTRAVVAGLSMGGYAALAVAERHRGLLAGIGLLDTKAEADDEDAAAGRLRVAEDADRRGARAVAGMVDTVLGSSTRDERPQVVAEVRGWLAEAPAGAVGWAQRAMAVRPPRFTALEDLAVPGLVLRGAEDVMSSQESAERMAGALPAGSELVIVPRAGHLSAVEDPVAVADALRQFYERLD